MKTALVIQKSQNIYIAYELLAKPDGSVEMDTVSYLDYPTLTPFKWRNDTGKFHEACVDLCGIPAAPGGICRALAAGGFSRILFVSKDGDGNPQVVRVED